MDLREADRIEVVSNKVEQPSRYGTVRQIVEDDPLMLEVTWEDGHTSRFMPAAGNVRVVTGSD